MADPFYDIRNALTIGNYHQAVAEASGAHTTARKADEVSAFNTEKETLLSLAQIGLGQTSAVISQLSSATHPTLCSVRSWAELHAALKAAPSADGIVSPAATAALARLTAAAADVSPGHIPCAVLAASALLATDDVPGALKLVKLWLAELPAAQSPAARRQSLELRAIAVEALLRLRRTELARAEVKAMEKEDDESVLTVLCSGVVSLHEGVKTRDAYNAALQRFKELSMRCGPSVLGNNLTALAHMSLDDFAAAERSLLDALAMKSGDADTTANLAVVSAHLGKAADATHRYTQQAAAYPGVWSLQFANMNTRLDDAIQQFQTAV